MISSILRPRNWLATHDDERAFCAGMSRGNFAEKPLQAVLRFVTRNRGRSSEARWT